MIELEQLLSLFEDISLVSFSMCILNKKMFRISKNYQESEALRHQYFRLVGYAYQSHLLEMPRVANEKL
jgi:hypothetical protein